MTEHEFNELLRRSLSSQEEPADSLNRNIIKRAKESEMSKKRLHHKILTAAATAVVFLGVSTTALAAYHILTAPGAAKELQQEELAESFEAGNEIKQEMTEKDGGYEVTLLGLLTGRQLDSELSGDMGLTAERTYAAVAIAREDGAPIQEEDGDFLVSPLIEGLNPAMYNIVSMNGSKTWKALNGILYYIVDCDDITCFADRKIHLAVQEGAFYDNEAYAYEEASGKITRREEYKGLNLLFDLPVKAEAADKVKQEEYLSKLEEQWKEPGKAPAAVPAADEIVGRATLVEDSVKEMIPDADGNYYYEYLYGYEDGLEDKTTLSLNADWMSAEGESGYALGSYAEDGNGNKKYVILHRDENGKVTGMIYKE